MIIHLQNLQFFAHHGLHDEEKILGNQFIVDLKVEYHLSKLKNLTIADTINYENIFSLIKKRMDEPSELLETLAIEITASILEQFLQVNEVSISIYKQNPPIQYFNGNVGVNMILKR